MGKQVDGIYDSDPKSNPDAVRFDHITYNDVLQKKPEGDGRKRNRPDARQQNAIDRLFIG